MIRHRLINLGRRTNLPDLSRPEPAHSTLRKFTRHSAPQTNVGLKWTFLNVSFLETLNR